MATSVVTLTRRARKEHCCNICMGTIKPGSEYELQVTMVTRGSKRNPASFHVWKTHTDAPFCDDEFERIDREHAETPVAQVVAMAVENRVVLKVGLNGETITETEMVLVPRTISEVGLAFSSNSNSDDEKDIPF